MVSHVPERGADRRRGHPGPDDADRPTELRAQLLAQLGDADGAVVREMSRDGSVATGLPPGRYRIDLICGVMQVRGGAAEALVVYLRTPDQLRTISLRPALHAFDPQAEDTDGPTGTAVPDVVVAVSFTTTG